MFELNRELGFKKVCDQMLLSYEIAESLMGLSIEEELSEDQLELLVSIWVNPSWEDLERCSHLSGDLKWNSRSLEEWLRLVGEEHFLEYVGDFDFVEDRDYQLESPDKQSGVVVGSFLYTRDARNAIEEIVAQGGFWGGWKIVMIGPND